MRGNVLVRARRRLSRVILSDRTAFVLQFPQRRVILDFYPIDQYVFLISLQNGGDAENLAACVLAASRQFAKSVKSCHGAGCNPHTGCASSRKGRATLSGVGSRESSNGPRRGVMSSGIAGSLRTRIAQPWKARKRLPVSLERVDAETWTQGR